MIRQLLQPLYTTMRCRLTQFPDFNAYIQTHRQTTKNNLDGVTVKLAEAADFEHIITTVDKYRDGKRIAERTARGDICVVVYKHGALGHIRWIAVSPLPAWGGYTVHLAADEAYSYDSYTLPAFRRQGLASETRIFQMTYLEQQGVRYLYTDSRLDNIHTQRRWIERIHEGRQRHLGVATITTMLGWTRCTFTAETVATRQLLARLYNVPLQRIQIQPILNL
jgi:GNAT superfamily N-acetyltransferase